MKRVPARTQHGQSVIEFAVLSIALVPLFLAVPLLGKYLDLAHAAELAARYSAFEGTVANSASAWKTDTQLAAEVRRRFFGNSDAPVKSGDTAGDFAAHRNPLWSDHAARPLIADFANDVAVETSHSELSSLPPALTLGAESFGLRARNLHTGVVTVRPRNIPQLPPFDAIDLEIRRHQVLFVDSWAAGGPAAVSRRIADDGLLAYPIAPLKALGDTLGQLPALVLDPSMEVGKLEPDIVPCDRLESGC